LYLIEFWTQLTTFQPLLAPHFECIQMVLLSLVAFWIVQIVHRLVKFHWFSYCQFNNPSNCSNQCYWCMGDEDCQGTQIEFSSNSILDSQYWVFVTHVSFSKFELLHSHTNLTSSIVIFVYSFVQVENSNFNTFPSWGYWYG
jgi:hypothetical protein